MRLKLGRYEFAYCWHSQFQGRYRIRFGHVWQKRKWELEIYKFFAGLFY